MVESGRLLGKCVCLNFDEYPVSNVQANLYNIPMSDNSASGHSANIVKAIRNGFVAAFDHLGFVFISTFATFLLAVGVFALSLFAVYKLGLRIPAYLIYIPSIAVAWLMAVGVFYYANKAVFAIDAAASDLLEGIKKLFIPAILLLLLDGFITVVVFSDKLADAQYFWRNVAGLPGALLPVINMLALFFKILWLMMLLYHLPLLPAQLNMKSGPNPLVILKKSYLLMADNPGFTVVLFVVIIAFAVICALPMRVGFATVFLGAAAFILTHALRELFIKYGVVEEEKEVVEELPWRLPD